MSGPADAVLSAVFNLLVDVLFYGTGRLVMPLVTFGRAKDHRSWPKGHSLFDSIRRKNLCAIAAKNSVLESQYCFEEVCAETLYNLSGPADPFDPDTPYWIVPNAFALARYLGIDRGRVVEIVAAEPVAPRDAPKSGAPLS